jgi:hypothetical protein
MIVGRANAPTFPQRTENTGMNAMVPLPHGESLPASLAPDLTRAAELAREEKAASTRRAYRSDFQIFQAWCRDRGVSSLPAAAETVIEVKPAEIASKILDELASNRISGNSVSRYQNIQRHRMTVQLLQSSRRFAAARRALP